MGIAIATVAPSQEPIAGSKARTCNSPGKTERTLPSRSQRATGSPTASGDEHTAPATGSHSRALAADTGTLGVGD
eukprot:15478027-Alexandrium_andersonii.AAC.1